MTPKILEKLIVKYIIILTFILVVIFNLSTFTHYLIRITTAFSAILGGAIIAYIINTIMSPIENKFPLKNNVWIKKLKRPLSLLLSLSILSFIIYILFSLVVPSIIHLVNIIVSDTPKILMDINIKLNHFFERTPEIYKIFTFIKLDWDMLIKNILNFVRDWIFNTFETGVGFINIVISSTFNFILSFIFAIYILLEKERLIRLYKKVSSLYLTTKNQRKLNIILSTFHKTFSSFIRGQFIEAMILGSLCSLGMYILKMPYPIMIGVLVGFINIIPIIGAYIGGIIGIFTIFTVHPSLTIEFVIYLILLQQFESNVIYPKIVGNAVGLPGIYVLGTVIVLGTLAGIPGMLLGIPTVASIYKLAKLKLYCIDKSLSIKKEYDIKLRD